MVSMTPKEKRGMRMAIWEITSAFRDPHSALECDLM
jgi:hypothetical protein